MNTEVRPFDDLEPMPQGFSIAIDGPVAAGKGTLASALAERLDGVNINTGGMYRAVAYLANQDGVDIDNEGEVAKILPEVNVEFDHGRILLQGDDVTDQLNSPEMSVGSSKVATYRTVREDMVRKQRKMVIDGVNAGKMVVAEGRDIGTRVMPNASLKIMLIARDEVRAKRRLDQYLAKGLNHDLAEILADLQKRDEQDSTREIDPLPLRNPEAHGYWVLDTSDQTEGQTIEAVITELKKRGLLND